MTRYQALVHNVRESFYLARISIAQIEATNRLRCPENYLTMKNRAKDVIKCLLSCNVVVIRFLLIYHPDLDKIPEPQIEGRCCRRNASIAIRGIPCLMAV